MKGNALDFSFSGLKTAVLRWVEAHDMAAEIASPQSPYAQPVPTGQWLRRHSANHLDLLASVSNKPSSTNSSATAAAAETSGASSVIVSGGVACNAGLRRATTPPVFPLLLPHPGLSTDNAAMIAAAAYPKFLRQDFAGFDLKAQAGLTLA